MNNSTLSVGLALAFLASPALGAGQKFTCRLTSKTMDKWCYEIKDRKFHCKLTKKTRF